MTHLKAQERKLKKDIEELNEAIRVTKLKLKMQKKRIVVRDLREKTSRLGRLKSSGRRYGKGLLKQGQKSLLRELHRY